MQTPTRKQVAGGSAAIAAAAILAMAGLKADEGFRTKAYYDSVKVVTICYGHTGGVKITDQKTPAQCEQILKDDFSVHARNVLTCAPNLTNDVHALAGWSRFDFNTGKFCSSAPSMKRARANIAAGFIKTSCPEMGLWVYAGGKRLQGLVNRRQREIAMCEA